jgi:hypothetical protein
MSLNKLVSSVSLMIVTGFLIVIAVRSYDTYGCRMRMCPGNDKMVICLTDEFGKLNCSNDTVPADICSNFEPYSGYEDSLKCKHLNNHYDSKKLKQFDTTPYVGHAMGIIVFVILTISLGTGAFGVTFFYESVKNLRMVCASDWCVRRSQHQMIPMSEV